MKKKKPKKCGCGSTRTIKRGNEFFCKRCGYLNSPNKELNIIRYKK